MRHRLRSQAGFTMMELLVVIVMIGIMALTSIQALQNQEDKAYDSTVRQKLDTAYKAAFATRVFRQGNSFPSATEIRNQIQESEPSLTVALTPTLINPMVLGTTYVVQSGTDADSVLLAEKSQTGLVFTEEASIAGGSPTQGEINQQDYQESLLALGPGMHLPLGDSDGLVDASGNGRNATAGGGVSVGGGPTFLAQDPARSTDFNGSSHFLSTSYTTRRNWARRPIGALLDAGYAANAGSVTRVLDTNYGLSSLGATRLRITGTGGVGQQNLNDGINHIPLTPGETVTVTAQVNKTMAPGFAFVGVDLSRASQYDSTPLTSSSTVGTYSLTRTFTVPANVISGNISVGLTGIPNGATSEVIFDRMIIEKESSTGTFFPRPADLNQAKAGWTGTAYNSASDLGVFANGTSRTFMGWASRDTNNTWDTLFGQPMDMGSSKRSALFLGNGNQSVYIHPRNAGSPTIIGTWPGNNQWVHWAVVFNEPANQATLYINGVSQGPVAVSETWDERTSLGIGAISGHPFDGKIGQFSVFEKALTAQQICQTFMAGSSQGC